MKNRARSIGGVRMKLLKIAAAASLLWFFSLPGPAMAAQTVAVNFDAGAGTIIIKTTQRRLYLMTGPHQALAYPVGVGRAGKQWAGESYIYSKRLRPAWSPPAEIKRDRPSIPDVIPAGAPGNPMGAAALLLAYDQYAIHGTNNPGSIGGFVSYGCIRMHNRDVLDLYERVSVGTKVIVMH
jgi:lipoprotein-anchoring transpeptidase ErfK/SrfK